MPGDRSLQLRILLAVTEANIAKMPLAGRRCRLSRTDAAEFARLIEQQEPGASAEFRRAGIELFGVRCYEDQAHTGDPVVEMTRVDDPS